MSLSSAPFSEAAKHVRDKLGKLDLVITTRYADYLPQKPTLPVPEGLTQAFMAEHPPAEPVSCFAAC